MRSVAGTDLLRFAAERADIIGLSGLGRTKPDGHRHEIRWASSQVQGQLDLIAQVSSIRGQAPALEVLVQTVEETSNRREAAETLATKIGGTTSADDLLVAPFVLLGTPAQMAEQLLQRQQQQWIDRCVVRESALTVMEKVLDHLPR